MKNSEEREDIFTGTKNIITNALYFLLSFIVIVILIIVALFYLEQDKHLGGGYYFFPAKRSEVIILSDSSNYTGGGSQIIPPRVINFAYNDTYIIVQSAWDKLGTSSTFWIIDKRNVPNRRKDYTIFQWDSVMWQNVSQYPDSASFYQALKAKNIDLEFDD